jgi:hypothetical protein
VGNTHHLEGLGFSADAITSAGVLFRKLEGYVVLPWRDEGGRALSLYGRWPGAVPLGKDGKPLRPKTMALPNPKWGLHTKRAPLGLCDLPLLGANPELFWGFAAGLGAVLFP